MNIFICDSVTGRIVRSVSCPDSMVDIQAGPGEQSVEQVSGVAPATHYFNNESFHEFGVQPSDHHVWDWATHAWALKDTALDDAKSQQSTLLDEACRDAILTGFASAALGTIHHYPAKAQDQANLVASVTDSLIPGLATDWTTAFWCECAGIWNYEPHTAAQIQQAGRDGKAAILAALGKNEYLQRQIQAATSIEAVQVIIW